MLGCIFSTNLFTLGLFLPITAGVIILCNIWFGVLWFKKHRAKTKSAPPSQDDSDT